VAGGRAVDWGGNLPVMTKPSLRNWFRQAMERFPEWIAKERPDDTVEISRIRVVERDLGIPVKLFLLVLLGYFFWASRWFDELAFFRESFLEVVQLFFLLYVVLNLVTGVLLAVMDRLSPGLVRETVLVVCLVDALFLGVLTVIMGGFDSMLFWLYPGLLVRNALSLPQAGRQIPLNLWVTACYVGAGLLEGVTQQIEIELLLPDMLRLLYPTGAVAPPTEPVLLRVSLLLLVAACCYGVEVLLDKQRRVEEETREFGQRQQQLESAGRLAAEIAHQLKNPLAIINNAAFTLQRTVKEGKTITQQIRIIRDEVERSDRIITELMGYARLVEGHVERLEVVEEMERAVAQVFPAAAPYEVTIEREYVPPLPALFMQRAHLSEVLVNLMKNAREAMQGRGTLRLSARAVEGGRVEMVVADDGPGITAEVLERVFEAYYSTKEGGSGLGLAIVKHNVEIYGGEIRAESELGRGTRFILKFPVKTQARLRR
jgi:signal transduction histidine kinase